MSRYGHHNEAEADAHRIRTLLADFNDAILDRINRADPDERQELLDRLHQAAANPVRFVITESERE